MAYALQQKNNKYKKLYLFDTFNGMPKLANNDSSTHKPGDFDDVSLSLVKKFLEDFSFILFHPGILPETFNEILNIKFAFVHIDVDLYQTTKECCMFFYNRMVPGGIMIFDDYGFKSELPAKKGIDEFFNDKPENLISLHTGQCFTIKL